MSCINEMAFSYAVGAVGSFLSRASDPHLHESRNRSGTLEPLYRLVNAIKRHHPESTQYQRALRYVLKTLYDLVGQPVTEELHRLDIPFQSRIWWCPTSAFCTLPLHAMGPFTLPDGAKGYFTDLYTPSYTLPCPHSSHLAKPAVQCSINLPYLSQNSMNLSQTR